MTESTNRNLIEIMAVEQHLAILDQCQNLGLNGYTTNFILQRFNKLSEMLENEIENPMLREILKEALH